MKNTGDWMPQNMIHTIVIYSALSLNPLTCFFFHGVKNSLNFWSELVRVWRMKHWKPSEYRFECSTVVVVIRFRKEPCLMFSMMPNMPRGFTSRFTSRPYNVLYLSLPCCYWRAELSLVAPGCVVHLDALFSVAWCKHGNHSHDTHGNLFKQHTNKGKFHQRPYYFCTSDWTTQKSVDSTDESSAIVAIFGYLYI